MKTQETTRRTRWIGWLFAILLLAGTKTVPAGGQARIVSEYLLSQEGVTLPFEYVQHQILVRGEVDGKRDLTFLFDTGATACVLDKSLNVLGYFVGNTSVREPQGSSKADTLLLDNFFLGVPGNGAHVRNVPVLQADLRQVGKMIGRKVDGIIGLTFMAGYVVEVDYKEHKLRFHAGGSNVMTDRKPDSSRTFLLDLVSGDPLKPNANLYLSGKLHTQYDYQFMLDTGFGGYVSVTQNAAQESGLIKRNTPRVRSVNFSVSHSFESDKVRAPFLMLGPVNISGRVVQVDARGSDGEGAFGIVGNRWLQNYNLIVDFPHRKLWMERITEKEEPDEAERPALGLTLRPMGSDWVIARVMPGSPAFRSGLRVGDQVVNCNGKPLHALPENDVNRLFDLGDKNQLALDVRYIIDPNLGTGGNINHVTLRAVSPLDWKRPE